MRKLGQHFLRDEKLAEKIVEHAKLSSKDTVLEIGPGKGILTRIIAKKCKVVAVEKDESLLEYLDDIKNLKIIVGDAVKVRLPKFNKIISNLPYHISSPITFRLFEYDWDLAILMYQKEFAQRFFAEPGDKNYSRLTLGINYHCKPKLLEKVSKGRFSPMPRVDSVVVKLIKKKPEFKTNRKFWELVKKTFQHKRKTMKNALKDSKYSKKLINAVPEELLKKRVFNCDLNDFKEIAKNMSIL